MTVTVRTAPGTPSPVNAIRSELLSLDPNVPMRSIETLQEAMNREVAPTRLYLILIVSFAGVAVFLTAVGLYGVVAYLVSRRKREIGIRLALGVRGGTIIRQVSFQGLLPAMTGLILGLVASVASARVLASLFFEVKPHDPFVILGASALVIVISGVAALVPAWRALGVDPVTVMRAE
jgi:putative ABC transport system permease protein